AFEKHIGTRQQLAQHILRRLAREVEHDTLLAGVVKPVVEAVVGVGFVLYKRPGPAAGTAIDRLDLNHTRAAIREELARPLVTAIGKLNHREAFVHPAHAPPCFRCAATAPTQCGTLRNHANDISTAAGWAARGHGTNHTKIFGLFRAFATVGDLLCSAITPSPSLWTIILAPRIIVRDHNLVTEGHLGHGTMHKSTPHCVASHWHATHVFG